MDPDLDNNISRSKPICRSRSRKDGQLSKTITNILLYIITCTKSCIFAAPITTPSRIPQLTITNFTSNLDCPLRQDDSIAIAVIVNMSAVSEREWLPELTIDAVGYPEPIQICQLYIGHPNLEDPQAQLCHATHGSGCECVIGLDDSYLIVVSHKVKVAFRHTFFQASMASVDGRKAVSAKIPYPEVQENIHCHYAPGDKFILLRRGDSVLLSPNKLHHMKLCLHGLRPPFNVTIRLWTKTRRYELTSHDSYCFKLVLNTSWYAPETNLDSNLEIQYSEMSHCGRREVLRYKIMGQISQLSMLYLMFLLSSLFIVVFFILNPFTKHSFALTRFGIFRF